MTEYSITAAFSAKGPQENAVEDVYENRGLSYAMGGDGGYVTLPNLIRRSGLLCPPFQYRPKLDRFNAAQSGAVVSNLMHELADYLVPMVQADKNVNLEEDWKLLTLFIMSNDLCLSCNPTSPLPPTWLSPELFSAHLERTLLYTRSMLPRTLVNVLLGLNVSGVYPLTKDDPHCSALRHAGGIFECTCAFSLGDTAAGDALRLQMDTQAQFYNNAVIKLRETFLPGGRNYDPAHEDSFALVVEPGMAGVKVDSWPTDMLSGVDCFHPSTRAHAWMASILWNNLHLPFEDKIRLPKPPIDINRTREVSFEGHLRSQGSDLPPAGISEVPLWCPSAESRVATR
ncbi:hypothetical protein HDU93_009865 [Gonapodya sp. JEL0774]|nr:hypothetical protein HDU93_009865 [Gonapodya sp. JEL0774]